MVFALICDIHMFDDNGSIQYDFLKKAVAGIREDGINNVITLGDITSFGEEQELNKFLEATADFNSKYVIGNSDVRDSFTYDYFLGKAEDFKLTVGNRSIYGLNVYDGVVSDKSRDFIKDIKDGDIIMLHYSLQGLEEESRDFLISIAEKYSIEIIHGHSHRAEGYTQGKSHITGLRALDPDKSIGNFPCITYMNVNDDGISFEEKLFDIPREAVKDVFSCFGLSCVDNFKDVRYATDNNIKAVELRTNGSDWYPDLSIIPEIEKWRSGGGIYLSVHMPNLKWADGKLSGEEQWRLAVDYAKAVKADGLTIHPPRVKKRELLNDEKIWNTFLDLYVYAVKSMDDNVKIGIENLHISHSEEESADYSFGYTPNEVSAWIDAINERTLPDRAGHLLDVGHARNNGIFAQMYPISKWYQIMGKKAVAYHIHQVIPSEDGIKNHNAIENWFGPYINYTSFFYGWENDVINHCTVFLEVKGSENYAKSVAALKKQFGI